MRVLTWITVVYAGVLVAAVAVALIAICALLWRVSFVLRDVRKALVSVAEATEPLNRQLSGVADGSTGIADALASAHDDLSRAAEHVDARAGRLAASR